MEKEKAMPVTRRRRRRRPRTREARERPSTTTMSARPMRASTRRPGRPTRASTRRPGRRPMQASTRRPGRPRRLARWATTPRAGRTPSTGRSVSSELRGLPVRLLPERGGSCVCSVCMTPSAAVWTACLHGTTRLLALNPTTSNSTEKSCVTNGICQSALLVETGFPPSPSVKSIKRSLTIKQGPQTVELLVGRQDGSPSKSVYSKGGSYESMIQDIESLDPVISVVESEHNHERLVSLLADCQSSGSALMDSDDCQESELRCGSPTSKEDLRIDPVLNGNNQERNAADEHGSKLNCAKNKVTGDKNKKCSACETRQWNRP